MRPLFQNNYENDSSNNNSNDNGNNKIFLRVDPSPNGKYLITESILRPYSRLVPYWRFPVHKQIVEIETGEIIKDLGKPLLQNFLLLFSFSICYLYVICIISIINIIVNFIIIIIILFY